MRAQDMAVLTDNDSEIGALAAIGPLGDSPRSKYERLIARAKEVPPATTVVVHPCNESSLRGVVEAAQAGIIVPILVGPTAKISSVANTHKLKIDGIQIVELLTATPRRQRGSSSYTNPRASC
jgi:phosphotransacetylase